MAQDSMKLSNRNLFLWLQRHLPILTDSLRHGTRCCVFERTHPIVTMLVILNLTVQGVFLSGCSLRHSNRHGDFVLVKNKRMFAFKAAPSATWLLRSDWISLRERGTVILHTKDLPSNIVIGEFQLQFRSRDFIKQVEKARSAAIDIVVTDEKGQKLYSKTHAMASLNWIHQRSHNLAFSTTEELEKALTGYGSYKIQVSILKPAPDFKGRFRIAGTRPVWNTNH